MTDQRRSELVEIVAKTLRDEVMDEQLYWLAELILNRLTAAGVDLECWRDIESAPKDGTLIIGARFNGYRDERFGAKALWWQPEFKEWISGCREMTLAKGLTFEDGSNTRLHSPDIYRPSHWLHYPTPPKDKP